MKEASKIPTDFRPSIKFPSGAYKIPFFFLHCSLVLYIINRDVIGTYIIVYRYIHLYNYILCDVTTFGPPILKIWYEEDGGRGGLPSLGTCRDPLRRLFYTGCTRWSRRGALGPLLVFSLDSRSESW